jgi:hypothetical protein
MKKKIIGVVLCTLVLAMTFLPVAGSALPVAVSEQTYKAGEDEYTAKGGFVCCGGLSVDVSVTQSLTDGTNFIWGKSVIISGDMVCVGVAGLKKTNWIGYMKTGGGIFHGTLTIGKFWGAIIKLVSNSSAYILTGIGANIQYSGETPTP